MAASGGRNRDPELKNFIAKIRQYIAHGDSDKLFSDDNFILDLLKVVYEDSVDQVIKTELVLSLEEYGYSALTPSSAEQVVSSLLDVFNQNVNREDTHNFCIQLLITLTSIVLLKKLLIKTIGENVIKRLFEVISKVNHVPSRRIRGCCCQCLNQIEQFYSGTLVKYKDDIEKFSRQEKTYVHQDYSTLLCTVLESCNSERETSPQSSTEKELLPTVSYIMENIALMTPVGLWSIVLPLVEVIKHNTSISPIIFKPFMLHHMATFDPVIFHIVLYLQKEFKGEILSTEEEHKLLHRLILGINYPSLSPAQRLLNIQWLKAYNQDSDENGNKKLPDFVCQNFQQEFYPSVFDSLELKFGKLSLLCRSKTEDQGDDFNNNLIKQTQEIQQLTETTGRHKPALALYKAFYLFYSQHPSQYLVQTIQGITHKLLGRYPALIPLVLDFLRCIRESNPDSSVYMDILSTLHQSVLSISYQDVFNQYLFYLQVFQTSAREKQLNQATTVKYLNGLLDYSLRNDICDWYFGNSILSICRNILTFQDTSTVFSELGELLYDIMVYCNDTDIKDKGRFYYALLTNAADKKIHSVLSDMVPSGKVTGQNFSSLLPGSMTDKDKAKIIPVEESLFVWEREEINPVFLMKDENMSIKSTSIEEYKNMLENMEISLQARYKLILKDESNYDTIHAVSVVLDNNHYYKPVSNNHLNMMKKSDIYHVTLTYQPIEPYPADFNARVMFAVENKTYSSELPDCQITFKDFLLPFPWDSFQILQDSQFLFWSNLWKHFTDSTDYPVKGVESHKISSCSLDKLLTLWKSYQIHGEKENEYPYLLLLPPSYHVLFNVKVKKENLVIAIATDHWKLLPHINNYLNSLSTLK
ncbi:hypothetical protein LOTGIDRAFT_232378 [Lottia gigantea]|uniref:Uncharacterized protein n=1 Tax=Lottia gigantea TaxID=225164 RepID=V4AHB4_LOTGI|nr:hypothetical protein LOTGIDRAFT_232378 [Lottia gigantea]ESO94575.1 hypothetical protein LOTGIDRAFT_232378 [Lottia gigantea]